jgi:hypothetical protein
MYFGTFSDNFYVLGKGDGLLSEFVSDTYKSSAVKIKID